MTFQPSASVSQAPDRLPSLTNLSRAEALWRSQVLSVQELAVVIDLTSAPDPQATGFAVRSELTLQVLTPCSGAWIDFLGEEVVSLSVDDHPVQVSWDGARVALPDLEAGEHRVAVEARGRYSNSGQGLHRFHDPVDGATYRSPVPAPCARGRPTSTPTSSPRTRGGPGPRWTSPTSSRPSA